MEEVLLLLIGLSMMVWGANLLIVGSKSLAKSLGVSELIIGLTILAFGTSLPELVVSIVASAEGKTDFTIGNIIGSNIANILLILGTTAIIAPIAVKRSTIWKEIPFSFLGIIVLAIISSDIVLQSATFSEISRADGLILLSFFMVYLYHLFNSAKSSRNDGKESREKIEFKFSNVFLIIAGAFILAIGGQSTVVSAEIIAGNIGINDTVAGLTILAIGTSMPELITTILAVVRKENNLAIGNVVGSNIFNVFWILGISSLISPIRVSTDISIDLLVLILASMIMFLFLFIGKTKSNIIDRYEGLLLLFFFFGYVIFNLVRTT